MEWQTLASLKVRLHLHEQYLCQKTGYPTLLWEFRRTELRTATPQDGDNPWDGGLHYIQNSYNYISNIQLRNFEILRSQFAA